MNDPTDHDPSAPPPPSDHGPPPGDDGGADTERTTPGDGDGGVGTDRTPGDEDAPGRGGDADGGDRPVPDVRRAAPPAGASASPLAPGAVRPQPPRRRGVFVDVGELRQYVGDLLGAMLGSYEVDAFGSMTFEHEGARVYVTVTPGQLGPQVGVFSITNVDVELTPQLAMFLLGSNHRLAFGAFSYDEENRAVWLRHTLLGGTLDGPELRGAVLAVSQLAARADDAIAERFGGHRFVDEPADAQARARPPEPEGDDEVVNASGYL